VGGAWECQTRLVQPHRLLLVRHAKSADGPIDLERPLNKRGARYAAAIGPWLEQAGLVPDRVLVSPAKRARQTWEQAGASLPPDLRPDIDRRIYENTVESLLAVIRETPEDVRTVAIVGHNPSIGELTAVLDDGEGSPEARSEVDAGFRTGGVAVFLVATPFDALEPGAATLSDFAVPGD
jgi:phosphohistidine phosphatase